MKKLVLAAFLSLVAPALAATPSTFYVVDESLSSPRVTTVAGNVTADIGATLTSAQDNNTSKGSAFYDMPNITLFQGRTSEIVVVTGGQIYYSSNSGTSWTSEHTLTHISSTAQGFHAGIRTYGGLLFVMYSDAASPKNTYYVAYSTDAVNWTETAGVISPQSVQYFAFGDAVFFNGLFYAITYDCLTTGNQGDIVIFDPVGRTITNVVNDGLSAILVPRMCVYNNKICILWHQSSSGNVNIEEYNGVSTFTLKSSAFQAYATQGTASSSWALFVHSGYLWALTHNGATPHLDRFDPGYTHTNEDSAIPSSTYTVAAGRFRAYWDTTGTASTPNEVFILYKSDNSSGTDFQFHQFNDTSVMTVIGSGTAGAVTGGAGPRAGNDTMIWGVQNITPPTFPVLAGPEGQTTTVGDPVLPLGSSQYNNTTMLGNSALVLDKTCIGMTIASDTAESTMYQWTMPANTLGTSNRLRLSLRGALTTAASTPGTFTVKFKVGATTLTVVSAATLNTSASSACVKIDCEIAASNSTQAQTLHGSYVDGSGSGGQTSPFNARTTATLDTTTALAVVVTWQFSSGTTNTFTMDSCFVELLQ